MTRFPGHCGPECFTCRRGVEHCALQRGKAAGQYPGFNKHRCREGNNEQPDSQHRLDVDQQQLPSMTWKPNANQSPHSAILFSPSVQTSRRAPTGGRDAKIALRASRQKAAPDASIKKAAEAAAFFTFDLAQIEPARTICATWSAQIDCARAVGWTASANRY